MLKRVNKEPICCPVVFFEEIWGGKYPAGPRASCLNPFRPCRNHLLTAQITLSFFSIQLSSLEKLMCLWEVFLGDVFACKVNQNNYLNVFDS